jgi:hypothetical protein
MTVTGGVFEELPQAGTSGQRCGGADSARETRHDPEP